MFARTAAAALLTICLAAPAAAQSAQVLVINADAPGIGFNDPTPATPVGGNPGTTRGQQALNVFQTAANRWAANLQSTQPILVIASFAPLTCTPTSAVLGGAGAWNYFANVTPAKGGRALVPDTWYPAALAEKITRQDIVVPNDLPVEIFAVFNGNLGNPGCLDGRGWYYGLDNNEGPVLTDLLAVVLHEIGHGLGVSVFPTSGQTGARAQGFASVWEQYLLDLTSGKRWLEMTPAERVASAINTNNLVWAGQQVTNKVASVLDFRPEFVGIEPAFPVQDVQPAAFGPALSRTRGYVVAPADGGGASPLDGCEPFPATAAIPGNIVLVNRGTCDFTLKVKNAQDAGAIAAIVANNVATGLPGMGGTNPAITIPSWGITQALGTQLRSTAPALVELTLNPQIRLGTTAGYARLYAPLTFSSGSSVSHFDTTLTPNVLMEPFINSNLTQRVKNPVDLTRALLADIGW